MANITPQSVATAGTDETLQAATSSDTIINVPSGTGQRLRYRVATTGTSTTVSFSEVVQCNHGHALTPVSWGPLTGTGTHEFDVPSFCVDTSTGHVTVAHSATTGVTVGAFLVP